MLFSARTRPCWRERARVALWPRRSFARSARYAGRRIVRLGGSAHGLALGVAAGVFVATLPIPGVQLLVAGLLAWTIRGNVPAALLGTFWANPLTLPLLWPAAHWLGSHVLGTPATLDAAVLIARLGHVRATLLTPGAETLTSVYALLWPVWKPLAIGSLPLAALFAVVFYGLAHNLIAGHRTARREAKLAPRRAVDLQPTPPLSLSTASGP